MYDETHFTRDAATVEFDDSASGIAVDDAGEPSFDWDEVETVTVDQPPHAEAFDTKEFYKLPATVARPIAQPYQYGEDTLWLKKPREELKKAAWSLDNAPWTLGHPESGMVKDVDDVHGFWSNPRYIDSLDDLDADLHIPVDDDEALDFLERHSDVSVGFYNQVVSPGDFDGVVGGEDADGVDIDGYQTQMLFDHCASVGVGRCPSEKGCGIDATNHGHVSVVDSAPSKSRDGAALAEFLEAMVSGIAANSDMKRADVIADMAETAEVSERTVRRYMNGEIACPKPDVARGLAEALGVNSAMVFSAMMRDGCSLTSDARAAVDSFKWGTGTTDGHEDTQGTMQSTTDAPEGIFVADGVWFAVAPDEHPDENTDHAQDAKFPVDSCADIEDAWNLAGTGDISIEESTLRERIKRAAGAKDCPAENRPWTDGDKPTADAVAESAKRYSTCGSRDLRDRGDCGCDDTDNTSDMTDDTDTDGGIEIGVDDLSAEAALAKVEAQNDAVSEHLDELRAAQDAAEAAEEAADELDLDSVDDLPDQVALLREARDDLEAKVEELQRPEMEDDAEFIAEHTDRFGDDAEEVLDELDEDPELVAEKRELVEDLAASYDETTANPDDDSGSDGVTRDGKYARTPWD